MRIKVALIPNNDATQKTMPHTEAWSRTEVNLWARIKAKSYQAEDGKLYEGAVVRKFRTTATDRKTYQIDYNNRGVIWQTKKLRV